MSAEYVTEECVVCGTGDVEVMQHRPLLVRCLDADCGAEYKVPSALMGSDPWA
jgi:hypothetical protein